MPICEGCTASFDDSFQVCPQCGRVRKIEKPIKVDVSVAEKLSGSECPICHKDDKVAKVTAIVQRDTNRLNGSVPVSSTHLDSDGKLRSSTDWSNFSAIQISDLAQQLSPPDKPTHGCLSIWNAWGFKPFAVFLVLVSLLFCVGSVGGNETDRSGIGISAFFLAIAVGFWFLGVWWKKRGDASLKPQMDKWNHAMGRWFTLYYCSRDDCVFIPGEDRSVPVYNMMDLISRDK